MQSGTDATLIWLIGVMGSIIDSLGNMLVTDKIPLLLIFIVILLERIIRLLKELVETVRSLRTSLDEFGRDALDKLDEIAKKL